MKNRNPNFHLLNFIILISMGLAGCSSSGTYVRQESITSSPKLLPSTISGSVGIPTAIELAMPSPTMISSTPFKSVTSPTAVSIPMPPTPTPIATQNPEQSVRMIELLHSKDCRLPCYMGITPGKTSLSEAKVILEGIGARYHGSYTRDSDLRTEYAYDTWIADPSDPHTTPEANGDWNIIPQSISLWSNNETVQIIETGAQSTRSKIKYQEYWSLFSAKEILSRYGPPEEMYIFRVDPETAYLGHKLLMVYEKLGAVIEIYGDKEENNLCTKPGYEAHFLELRLSTYDPNSSINIFADGQISPKNQSVWLPVKVSLGIIPIEFYQDVITDPSICFTPNK